MSRVTVIIPTYRRPVFLHNAIKSVLNQTFQDFEVIIVDDASNDRTSEVVKSFTDSRICYIHHETNKGGSVARNTGIRNAHGEYIAFLDDDDEWLPEKLGQQVEVMEKSPPGIGGVFTGCTKIDRVSGKIVGRKTPMQRGRLSQTLLVKNCISSTSSILLRKECIERVGLFDESLPSFQDYDLWLRISREFQFESIQEPLFIYHIHDKKIWTNLEALSTGLSLILEKHGKDISVFRRNFGYNGYLEIGALYCLNGNVKKGQESYLKAITLFPFGVKAYCILFLCLLGKAAVKKALDMRKGMTFA